MKTEVKELEKEMCKHMKALVKYCRDNKVYFGGCGDCGSAWLECVECNLEVETAHKIFDEYYGGKR